MHYLPHYAVIQNEAKTTKICVVHDAMSKEGKGAVPLNDCLHVGSALSPLYKILITFREKRVVSVGNIEKAFLKVKLKLHNRDCLRFLWVNNDSSDQVDPVVYRFCWVVFGLNCSPFLLNATLTGEYFQKHIIGKVIGSLINPINKFINGKQNSSHSWKT